MKLYIYSLVFTITNPRYCFFSIRENRIMGKLCYKVIYILYTIMGEDIFKIKTLFRLKPKKINSTMDKKGAFVLYTYCGR